MPESNAGAVGTSPAHAVAQTLNAAQMLPASRFFIPWILFTVARMMARPCSVRYIVLRSLIGCRRTLASRGPETGARSGTLEAEILSTDLATLRRSPFQRKSPRQTSNQQET
jgi:hypothetical protein